MFEIRKEDILSRMKFDNPWWDIKKDCKVFFQDSIRRKYFPVFFNQISDKSVNRAVVLMGPRRVGKTVMVYHAIRELIDSGTGGDSIFYLSLETPIYTGLSLEQLVNFFVEHNKLGRNDNVYIFFDEIQYLKNWEVHLKSLVDSYPDYKFVATGSAAAALKLKSNESGAGRFRDFMLPPLTFAEYLMFVGKEEDLIECTTDEQDKFNYKVKDIKGLNCEFVNYLNYGGYPEAVLSKTVRDNQEQFIKSDIIDKVLLRDLPSLYGISDIQELNRLFNTLAYNTGNEVSLENLSKSSGVAKNTIKKYLEYLEAAFLIVRVERIDNNAKRFKRAMCFKVYLTNPSMRAALFGKVEENSEFMGQLTETAIFSQWQHGNAELYYARWNSGEVDIVHLSNKDLQPIWIVEVKWSDKPYYKHSELDNCVEFASKNVLFEKQICITTREISGKLNYRGQDFNFTPSGFYAYILGANLLRGICRRSDVPDL